MKGTLMLLLLLTVWLNLQPGHCSSSCSFPPHQWCSSLESAAQCGVLKECLMSNFTKAHQTDSLVQVDLYYESLCPACRMFLTQVLYPTWLMLNDIMSVSLVPFGNAKETSVEQKHTFECQHGPQECLGNMIETCLLNMTAAAFQIINCIESSYDVVGSGKSCVALFDPDLDWSKVMSCVNGDLGNDLMHQNAIMTQALQPPHQYVPWIVINGEHTDELQGKAEDALFILICSTYKGPKPTACGGGQKERLSRSFCSRE
ncbi:unnamed protein product [Ophioblennius macclurei]